MRRGQVGTRIKKDLPPGRLKLARTLCELYILLGECTLTEVAGRLSAGGYVTRSSDISRYLNGSRVPNVRFVEALHDLASKENASSAISVTLEQVREIHGGAEATRCTPCARGQQRNLALREENKQLKAREAGHLSQLASAQLRAKQPPVPRSEGDRRQHANDIAGAQQVARRAAELRDGGDPDAALALLLDAAGTLTPLEGAASVSVLRAKQHDQLAETLLLAYGRERPERHVIRVALELHEQGRADDAAVILRAAAGPEGSSGSVTRGGR
jgi:hypothetical protein